VLSVVVVDIVDVLVVSCPIAAVDVVVLAVLLGDVLDVVVVVLVGSTVQSQEQDEPGVPLRAPSSHASPRSVSTKPSPHAILMHASPCPTVLPSETVKSQSASDWQLTAPTFSQIPALHEPLAESSAPISTMENRQREPRSGSA